MSASSELMSDIPSSFRRKILSLATSQVERHYSQSNASREQKQELATLLSSQEFKGLVDPVELNPHTLEDTLRQLKGFRSTFVPPQSRQEAPSPRRSFSQGVKLFEAALKPDGVQR